MIWKKDTKVLGRWAIDTCHIKINKKVDYSNHDHCGPCGKIEIESNSVPVKKDSSIVKDNVKDI